MRTDSAIWTSISAVSSASVSRSARRRSTSACRLATRPAGGGVGAPADVPSGASSSAGGGLLSNRESLDGRESFRVSTINNLYSTVCPGRPAPSSSAQTPAQARHARLSTFPLAGSPACPFACRVGLERGRAPRPGGPLARVTRCTTRDGPFGPFDGPSLALKRLYCDHDNLPSAGGRRKRSRAGASRGPLRSDAPRAVPRGAPDSHEQAGRRLLLGGRPGRRGAQRVAWAPRAQGAGPRVRLPAPALPVDRHAARDGGRSDGHPAA